MFVKKTRIYDLAMQSLVLFETLRLLCGFRNQKRKLTKLFIVEDRADRET
jgi:hypothetical protein